MKRLFVHVGYPKTGTTSIQSAFFSERDYLLAKQSFLYPAACVARPEFGHHNLYWEAAAAPLFNSANGTVEDLVSEVHQPDPETILISSEALVLLLVDYPERFRDTFLDELHQYALTVILVVRRLDEAVESLYRQQFNAWTWDRPISASTDFQVYLDRFDVERTLAPIECLLDSDYDVVYVPYGPGMVERFVQLLELSPEACTKLTDHESVNVTWMSNRALAVIDYLVNRPDESELRHFVGNNRPSFRRLLESLGCERANDSSLVSTEAATALLAEAAPLYREVGGDFASAVMRDGPPTDSKVGTTRTTFDASEMDRINAFFGAVIMAADEP